MNPHGFVHKLRSTIGYTVITSSFLSAFNRYWYSLVQFLNFALNVVKVMIVIETNSLGLT